MSKFSDFLMRWRYRLDHAKVIFSLLTFAILLGFDFINYIPFLDKLGLGGVAILALIIFLLFAMVGYAYDRGFRFWQSHSKVNVERNPYSYVPNPKDKSVLRGLHLYRTYLLLEIKLGRTANIIVLGYWMKIIDLYYGLDPSDSQKHYLSVVKQCKVYGDMIQKALTDLMREMSGGQGR